MPPTSTLERWRGDRGSRHPRLFKSRIAPDAARIAAAVDATLADAGVAGSTNDRVFLTGGTSLVPAERRLFTGRFGSERIASGGELTSIEHGLAPIAQEDAPCAWTI